VSERKRKIRTVPGKRSRGGIQRGKIPYENSRKSWKEKIASMREDTKISKGKFYGSE